MKKILTVLSLVLCIGTSLSASPLQDAIDRAHRDGLYRLYLEKLKDTDTKVVTYPELVEAAKGYRVVVVGGYSGLGYEHPEMITSDLDFLVKAMGNHTLYVAGATSDGIGQLYKDIPAIARKYGFGDIKLAGIVSRNAAEWGIEPQDWVVFVDTAPDDWAVVVDGKSLYIQIAADCGGIVVYFRGGGTSKGEIEEALADGLPVYLVLDESTVPNKANVAKRTAKNPAYVTDGTVEIAQNAEKWKNLKIIK